MPESKKSLIRMLHNVLSKIYTLGRFFMGKKTFMELQ